LDRFAHDLESESMRRSVPAFCVALVFVSSLCAQGRNEGAKASTPAIPITTAQISVIRIFETPLVAIGGEPSMAENRALALALQRLAITSQQEPLERFLEQYPRSPWRASLQMNLGTMAYHAGALSRSLACWSEAWTLSKDQPGSAAAGVANRALGDLAELQAWLGQKEVLRGLLRESETRSRTLTGPSATKLMAARELLERMESDPQHAMLCGPAAMASLQQRIKPDEAHDRSVWNMEIGPKGTSLAQNGRWAETQKLNLQMAQHQPGATWPVPSMVHWKLGHYSAVLQRRGDLLLIKDAVLGGERWIREGVLDQESSGYALIPKTSLGQGWRAVSEDEGKQIWAGSCGPYWDTHATPPKNNDDRCDKKGMPVARLNVFNASLLIDDIPVSYAPPRGMEVAFQLSYNSKNIDQPATFAYSNVGAKWNFNWLLSMTDDPVTVGQTAYLYPSGGGQETFTGFNTVTQSYAPQYWTQDQLIRLTASSYKVIHKDGSVDLYDLSDGAVVAPRRIFRTKYTDPAGNVTTFGYDAQRRLTTVTDALGQVTTLSYTNTDPLKITQVQDPFGRVAILTYNATGLLASITDAVGLVSSFTYGVTPQFPGAAADFINTMTTPYGPTTFSGVNGSTNTGLIATDPMGNQKKVEYVANNLKVPASEPFAPPGVSNTGLGTVSSYYWDERAMALYPNDYTKAVIKQWLFEIGNTVGPVLQSEKRPLESRIWYLYAGQINSQEPGTIAEPSAILRVLDGGTVQSTFIQRNAIGKPTQMTDPSGRTTSYVYSADGIDLLEVHSLTATQDDLLAKYTYNTLHKPLTVKDAAGQTTTFTYNAFGQVLTISNPKSEVTTLAYNATGYLQSVTSPTVNAAQSSSTFTYDAVGRIRTVTTQPDVYTLTYDYDNLDRRVLVTYPDTTTEQTLYDRLDAWRSKDRLGRWTVMTYNALRQLIQVQDAQGRVTLLDWCGCGTLEGLTDPQGRTTMWVRDLQSRVVGKVYPSGSAMTYSYDGTGRLAKRLDAMGQSTLYTYFADNNLASVSYVNAVKATPNVSYTYDARYNRLLTMVDGTGTTSYAYNPIPVTPTLGAGRLASVTGPWSNSAITYSYDQLGRVTTRGINAVTETRAFDALGRITSVVNPLGTSTYAYDGPTGRLQTMTLPSGQKTSFSYLAVAGDKRLQQIQNLKSDNTNISTFAYTYDAVGQIQSWSQKADVQAPKVYTFGYDAVGQILSATLTDSGTSTVLKTFVYGYDESGNRTTEQINGATTTSTYNNLNQLTGQSFSATPSIRVTSPSAPLKKPSVKVPPTQTPSSKAPSSRVVALPKAVQR
jgi:YD repeat-containing protein